MAIEHPFQALFETFGRLPAVHAETVNRRAYEQMWDILAVGPEQAGRGILLRSPRAGHGKTHLLSRLQHHLGGAYEFIPLHAAHGSHIDAATVIGDVLARLGRPLPAGGGLTVLDLLIRKLFALALQPLVRSGEVPCEDREGALAALRNRPVETFDFHHPNAVTAHWTRENFDVLGPRLASELAQLSGSPLREVTFWVSALFQMASTPLDHPARTAVLLQAINHADQNATAVFDRLGSLLNLVSQVVRVVLIADDLEGFSADESAALRLASFLGSLRHSASRIDAIVSLNQDIWNSAFVPRLSGGLADRLAEIVVELEPLDHDQMVSLLEARAPGLGKQIFERLEQSNLETHARGILRAAGLAWASATRQSHTEPSLVSSVAEETRSEGHQTPTRTEYGHPTAPSQSSLPPSQVDIATAPRHSPVPDSTNPAQVLNPIAFEQSASSGAGGLSFGTTAPTPDQLTPGQPQGASPTQPFAPASAFQADVAGEAQPPAQPALENAFSSPGPTTTFVPPATSAASPYKAPAESALQQPEFGHEKPLSEVLANVAAEETPPPARTSPSSVASAPTHSPPSSTFAQVPHDGLSRSAESSAAIFGFGKAPNHEQPAAPAPAGGTVTPSPAPTPALESAPSPAPETDRVDELLRQFRERYSKG